MKSGYSWAELDELSQGKSFSEQENIRKMLIDRNNAQNIPTSKPKKNNKKKKKKKTIDEDALLNKAIKEAEQARKKIQPKPTPKPKTIDPYKMILENIEGEKKQDARRNAEIWVAVSRYVKSQYEGMIQMEGEFKSFEYYEAMLRIHVKDTFIQYMHALKETGSPLISNREDPFLMFSVQKDIMNELFPKVELVLSMKEAVKHGILPNNIFVFNPFKKPIMSAGLFYSFTFKFNILIVFYERDPEVFVYHQNIFNRHGNINDVLAGDIRYIRENRIEALLNEPAYDEDGNSRDVQVTFSTSYHNDAKEVYEMQ